MSIFHKDRGQRRFSILLLLIAIFLVFAVLPAVDAGLEEGNGFVGVEVGDWVKYDIQGETAHLEGKDWARIEVLGVSGTDLAVRILGGETPRNDTIIGNVTDSVRGDLGILVGMDFPFILPRDFNISSVNKTFVNSFAFSLFLSENFTWNVETLIRDYGEASREVNLIEVINTQYFDIHLTEWHSKFWWDKATGVVLEASFMYYLTNGSYVWGPYSYESMQVSETNLFQISRPQPFPIGTAILIVVVVAPSAFGIAALSVKNWMNRRHMKARQTG
jgi:hypothetical protein